MEAQVLSLSREDPLEEEMVTHCGNLAWKIPQIEEPGSLQSMGVMKESDMAERRNNSGNNRPVTGLGSQDTVIFGHFHTHLPLPEDFPTDSVGKESASMKESQEMWEDLGGEDPLEKGMATHPSILAWRIP